MEINHNCHKFILINPTKFAFEQQPIVIMGIPKNYKPNKGKKKWVNIRTYYPWNILDLCKSMIAIIVLLNFTPVWKIFFTCKEANVAILKGQNLSPKKLCPLDLMQENSTQKKMTMVVNIVFVVFIVSLL